jgi:hypothetical protein
MYIYIYLYIKREKERERKKLDGRVDVCLGERDLLYIVGEKNERKVPPRDKTHEKGGDNRIFFQEGRCGYLGLIFFSKSSLFFFHFFSLLCIVC